MKWTLQKWFSGAACDFACDSCGSYEIYAESDRAIWIAPWALWGRLNFPPFVWPFFACFPCLQFFHTQTCSDWPLLESRCFDQTCFEQEDITGVLELTCLYLKLDKIEEDGGGEIGTRPGLNYATMESLADVYYEEVLSEFQYSIAEIRRTRDLTERAKLLHGLSEICYISVDVMLTYPFVRQALFKEFESFFEALKGGEIPLDLRDQVNRLFGMLLETRRWLEKDPQCQF